MEYRSGLLASRGYIALSLEFCDHKNEVGKPRNVGIEYFEVLDTFITTYGYCSCKLLKRRHT